MGRTPRRNAALLDAFKKVKKKKKEEIKKEHCKYFPSEAHIGAGPARGGSRRGSRRGL
jgi:hypothetical protein